VAEGKELRVIFLTPGGLGSGEIVNAVLVAEQLRQRGVDCTFFTFPYGTRFIKPHNLECVTFGDDKLTNINLMKSYIEKKNPDVIVIADYYLFHTSGVLRKYLWVGWMEDLKIPVVSFDSLYLGREYPTAAYYINPELYPKQKCNITYEMPSFIETLIYPSPPFNKTPPDNRDVCGRLYEETFTDYEPDPSLREELGVHPDEKLIFHIIPKWEIMAVRKSSILSFPEYHSMVATLLTRHFKNLDENIHVFCINPSDKTLYTENTGFRVKEAAFFPFETYSKCLSAADLIITNNILSATTWKAMLRRVPTLVLGNSLTAKDAASKYEVIGKHFDVSSTFMDIICTYGKGSSDYLPVLPFWTFFTKYFAHMDIGKTFIIQELFDEKGTFEALTNVLTDEKFKKELRRRQDNYVKKIAKFPTMADIILLKAQELSKN
jgi:hypothetical protein